jgi:hypothetical protein
MIVDQKLNKQFAGVYLIDGVIDGTQLATTVRPNWFRILATKWFLGWKWISVTELKSRLEAVKVAKAHAEEILKAQAAEVQEVKE